MKIEIAEGLVIGPEDKLVVNVKDGDMWEDGFADEFSEALRGLIGDRFIILLGNMEIAKVEGA